MFRKIIPNKSSFGFLIRTYVPRRRVENPGVDKRLKVFADNTVKRNPELIEDSESDFMNVQEVHKQFEQEERNYQSHVQLWITKNKYFKKKNLNFLTWSEKEQIRFLHERDPDEWDLAKLCESFPADPETLLKIIKAKWQPRDDKRIAKHDLSVKKSWELYRTNQLPDLDPELKEHLKKFAHRDFDETAAPKVERKPLYEIQKPTTNEFSSIITSCKKYQENNQTKQIKAPEQLKIPDRPKDSSRDSFLLEDQQNLSRKSMTFKEFQKNSTIQIKQTEEIPEIPKSSVIDFKKLNKIQTEVDFGAEDQSVYKSLEVQQKIKIPKNLWKKGKTYKVEDCFYDDDGEFLYRVPGLK